MRCYRNRKKKFLTIKDKKLNTLIKSNKYVILVMPTEECKLLLKSNEILGYIELSKRESILWWR